MKMKNLFDRFVFRFIEDPPTGGGNNNGTGTGTGTGTGEDVEDNENLNSDTDNEDGKPGGNSGENSGGTITDDGVLRPDVGIGVF